MVKLVIGDRIGIKGSPFVCVVTSVEPLCAVDAESNVLENREFDGNFQPVHVRYNQEWSLWPMSLNLFRELQRERER